MAYLQTIWVSDESFWNKLLKIKQKKKNEESYVSSEFIPKCEENVSDDRVFLKSHASHNAILLQNSSWLSHQQHHSKHFQFENREIFFQHILCKLIDGSQF